MKSAAIFNPGEKTHRDENFPVASWVIAKEYRAPVLAFYNFVRAADDIADHPHLSEKEKLYRLDQFEAALLGANDAIPEALPLREELATRNLPARHALDLLVAFRQDASKHRYKDWGELLQYCMYSAAPVGRFVLDVHGESASSWPANDALCSVLQIINHLQDCKADYLQLNRIYIPQDALFGHGLKDSALGEANASEALRCCLVELVQKTQGHLSATPFSSQIKNTRLRLEVLTIEQIIDRLLALLMTRDPLSERVHLTSFQYSCVIAKTVLGHLAKRFK